jgi:hypothetical protein
MITEFVDTHSRNMGFVAECNLSCGALFGARGLLAEISIA